jgi:hypothetical protein
MSDLAAKAKREQAAIREILLREWDPIGVGAVAEAQDEYDAYVAGVYRLLSRRAEVGEVFKYLWWVETQHMGLKGDRQRTEKIAQKLVAVKDQEEAPA